MIRSFGQPGYYSLRFDFEVNVVNFEVKVVKCGSELLRKRKVLHEAIKFPNLKISVMRFPSLF